MKTITEQIPIVVSTDNAGHQKLADYLDKGWKVVNMCAMPSAIGGENFKYYAPTCLVIIERETQGD